jgi:hypothetical protein
MPGTPPDKENRTMTESQQSKRGWFGTWREQRRARRQELFESRLARHEGGSEFGRASAYQHSGPVTYGVGGGFDGGGCGGDGGGGC